MYISHFMNCYKPGPFHGLHFDWRKIGNFCCEIEMRLNTAETWRFILLPALYCSKENSQYALLENYHRKTIVELSQALVENWTALRQNSWRSNSLGKSKQSHIEPFHRFQYSHLTFRACSKCWTMFYAMTYNFRRSNYWLISPHQNFRFQMTLRL